ncbi:MAG: DUF177 domain-containing protein [Candidatus Omnitrophota bacterium]
MRIKIEKIKDKAIEVEEEIPASSWEIDSSDIAFINSICLKSKFLRVGEEIIVDSSVTTQREIICSRCLLTAQQTIDYNFKRAYKVSELGEYLEINDDIREDILLNFPMKVLCKEDCSGICPVCGVNLNQQQCNCQ